MVVGGGGVHSVLETSILLSTCFTQTDSKSFYVWFVLIVQIDTATEDEGEGLVPVRVGRRTLRN